VVGDGGLLRPDAFMEALSEVVWFDGDLQLDARRPSIGREVIEYQGFKSNPGDVETTSPYAMLPNEVLHLYASCQVKFMSDIVVTKFSSKSSTMWLLPIQVNFATSPSKQTKQRCQMIQNIWTST